ncbi:MAG: PilZ domain-containing protein [Nitrospirota bacterium]|nr:PilZ domain-containing protein [Nitrospirota bacterium]
MKPECPQCHAAIVRRISPSGPVERLFNIFSIYSFRCQLCAHRYRRLSVGTNNVAVISEKRQFERLQTNVRAIIVGPQGRSEDVITDLSMGGCTLHTTASLTKGAFLHLNLQPSGDESAIVVETAMVRSVRPECVGLEFLEFESEQKDRLARFVRSLLLTRQTINAMG